MESAEQRGRRAQLSSHNFEMQMDDHPDFYSGNWTGFYVESHRPNPGWMHLFLHCTEAGKLQGEGVDYVGPWTLQGTYTAATKVCEWTKSYVGKHRVHYRGLLSDDGIRGAWQIEPFLRGEFHIWPETMTHLTELYLQQNLPVLSDEPDKSLIDERTGSPLLR